MLSSSSIYLYCDTCVRVCVHVPPPAPHWVCWSMIRVLEVVFEGYLGFQMHDFHDSFGPWIGDKNNLLSSSR